MLGPLCALVVYREDSMPVAVLTWPAVTSAAAQTHHIIGVGWAEAPMEPVIVWRVGGTAIREINSLECISSSTGGPGVLSAVSTCFHKKHRQHYAGDESCSKQQRP